MFRDSKNNWAPIQNNKINFDQPSARISGTVRSSVRDSKEFKGSPRNFKRKQALSVEDELKIVRNIYENYEKHKLPVKNNKEIKDGLRQLRIVTTSDTTNPTIYNRAKDTLLYDDTYQKFSP